MRRVLVVDDDLVIRTLLEEQLSLNGYQVTTATNGVEAKRCVIEEHPKEPFSLIVVDMKMPLMDGLEFTQFVRNHNETSQLPVVMLTAENRIEDMENGTKAGVTAYFTKPCQIEALLTEIEEQLKPSS